MNNVDGRISWLLGLDNTQLRRDAGEARQQFRNLGNAVSDESKRMNDALNNAAKSFAAFLTIQQLGSFAKSIAEVRGEFQQLEIAFKVMLGSKDQADRLMSQLVETAARTPFDLKSIASGAKQLLAYGTASAEVNDTLIRLGDIASGLSIPLGDLVYLYGTTQTQGRLFTMDMRQFMGRGIPLAEELAKQFGVTKDKVAELVTAGAVGFPQVKLAIESMTNAGGKFHNLMAEQSKSITGQISNLGDAIASMMNEIGESNEGFINSVISGAGNLVENYKEVAKIIGVLVVAYGSYKAALITTAAIQKATTIAGNIGAWFQLAAGIKTAKDAQLAYNLATKANPIGLLISIIATVGTAMLMYSKNTDKATEALKDYYAQSEKAKLESEQLLSIIQNSDKGSKSYKDAVKKLTETYGPYIQGLINEKGHLTDITRARQLINQAIQQTIGLKIKEQAISDATTESLKKQASQYEKMVKTLVSSGLSESASRIYANQFTDDIKSGQSFASALSKIYDVAPSRINTNPFKNFVEEYSDMQKSISDINNKFGFILGDGNTEVLGPSKPEKMFISIKQQIDEASRSVEKLNKELEDLKSGKTPSVDYSFDIGEKEKELKSAKEKLNTLLGIDPKDQSKDQKEREKLIDQAKQNIENQAKLEKELYLKVEQSRIDAMAMGYDKELQQLKLDYEKKKFAIEEYSKDLLEAQNKVLKDQWLKDGKEESKFVPVVALDAKNQSMVLELGRQTDKVYEGEKTLLFSRLLTKYIDFTEKRKEIEREYNSDVEALNSQRNANNADAVESAIAEAFNQKQRDLESLRKAILDDNGLGSLLNGDMSEYLLSKVKKDLPLFHSIAEASTTQLLKAKESLKGIQLPDKLISDLEEAGFDTAELVALLEKAKKESTEQIDETLFDKLDAIVGKLINSLGQLGSSLEGLGGLAGEIGSVISGLSSGIGDIMSVFKKGASDVDRASAGISGLINLTNMVIGQIKANREEQDKFTASIAESVRQATLLRIEALAYKQSNIFGIENPYARAIAGAKQYAQSILEMQIASNKLSDGKVQVGTKKVVSGGNVATGMASGASVGAAIGSFVPVIGTLLGGAIGAALGGILGLVSIKTVPVFESLSKKYGKIFDKETFELNKQIIADYKLLDEETKKIVDNWNEIKEKAKQAQEEMKQNFKDLAGGLGTQLSNTLVNAFRNGNLFSAINDFKAYMTTTIEDIMAQMIFAQVFEETLKELQGKFMSSFQEGGDMSIVDDLTWFAEMYKGGLGEYQTLMEQFRQAMKSQGFDMWKPDSTRTGSSKGISSMNQESANELNGRFAVMQGHTYSLTESFKSLLLIMNNVLKYLSGIEANTKRLEAIEKDMSSVKNGVETINTKGILLRK